MLLSLPKFDYISINKHVLVLELFNKSLYEMTTHVRC